MRRSTLFVAAVLALALAKPISAQDPPARALRLSFDENGLVTLTASNVSLREILAEWARQCGCYVVNWDKLGGGPLPFPLQFEREPQKQVLDAILRSAAGYVLTPKRTDVRSASNYETIYIVPTSTAVAGAYVPPPPAPVYMPLPTPGSPEDEIPAVPSTPPPGAARPETPAQPNRPGMPTAPPAGGALGTTPPRPTGPPNVFVPIVPVTATPNRSSGPAGTPLPPGQVAPGAPTAPPPMPVPIVPAPTP